MSDGGLYKKEKLILSSYCLLNPIFIGSERRFEKLFISLQEICADEHQQKIGHFGSFCSAGHNRRRYCLRFFRGLCLCFRVWNSSFVSGGRICLQVKTSVIQIWRSRKKSDFDGKVKSSKFKARKFRGMRRTYSTSQWRGMQRNAEVGLFTKPSNLHDTFLDYSYDIHISWTGKRIPWIFLPPWPIEGSLGSGGENNYTLYSRVLFLNWRSYGR